MRPSHEQGAGRYYFWWPFGRARISLQSARNIVDALDRSRFEPILIGIDKAGHWHLNDTSNFLINQENPALIALNQSNRELAVVPGKASQQVVETSGQGLLEHIDVIFPIVHGTLGEDGCLQGLLRMADLPFVGSDVLGSAVCMDKDISKRLLRDAGIAVTPFITLTCRNAARTSFDTAVSTPGLPMFVKPANQGSSVGVSKVGNEAQYHAAVELALGFDEKCWWSPPSRAAKSNAPCWAMTTRSPAAAARSW